MKSSFIVLTLLLLAILSQNVLSHETFSEIYSKNFIYKAAVYSTLFLILFSLFFIFKFTHSAKKRFIFILLVTLIFLSVHYIFLGLIRFGSEISKEHHVLLSHLKEDEVAIVFEFKYNNFNEEVKVLKDGKEIHDNALITKPGSSEDVFFLIENKDRKKLNFISSLHEIKPISLKNFVDVECFCERFVIKGEKWHDNGQVNISESLEPGSIITIVHEVFGL